jgi:hypothetical protein
MAHNCVNCQHWQGNRNSSTASRGLCNCYCSVVAPKMWNMESPLPLKRFNIPFDPHDMKYFFPSNSIRKVLMTGYVSPDVTRVVRKEQDMRLILNKDNLVVGERVAKVKVVYFYTDRGFKCEYLEGKR